MGTSPLTITAPTLDRLHGERLAMISAMLKKALSLALIAIVLFGCKTSNLRSKLDDIDTPEVDCDCLNGVIYQVFEMETELGMMYSKFAGELTSSDFMTLTKIQDFIKFVS